MDILIKNMELPKINHPTMISIRSDGSIQKIDMLNECFVDTESKAVALPSHGRLIDADELQDVLGLVLSLVVSNELTEKEISLVHRTIGAISEAINDMDTVLEATE